jgi:tetratricopeptide (TPR) repeat protein
MRHRQPTAHRRLRSIVAAPLAAGAIALIVSACGSSSSSTSSTSSGTSSSSTSPPALLSAGLAAQKAGNLTVAIADYKKVVALAPSSTTASYANYNLGDIAQIDQNDPTAAETYYRAALAVNPNFVNALYNLAIILTPSQPLVAENYYQQVIALDSSNADAHLNLGFIYLSQGDTALAHAQFTKAIKLDPSLSSRIPASSK